MKEKVIWAEGILLSQHHFQQWDKYWQQEVQQRSKLFSAFAWGIAHIEIDEDALLNEQFRIKQLNAILPQGIWLKYDAFGKKPLSCELSSQPDKTISIYVAIAINQMVTGITGYPEPTTMPAWQANYRTVADELDAQREREVLLGKVNLQLFTDLQSREGFYTLKIAEVRNNGRGYETINTFIPSLLHIQANKFLTEQLSKWLEIILAKINFIKETQNFTDVKSTLAVKILSTAYAELRCLRQHLQFHPYHLYQVLNRLLAELMTFCPEHMLNDLPEYQHHNLTTTFTVIAQLLLQLLAAIMPSETFAVKLQQINEVLYRAENIDSKIFTDTELFIGIYCTMEDPSWITQFIRQVKICSSKNLDSIITSALPGVKLIHTQRPPANLSTKSGYEYFFLEPVGEFWQQIKQERNVAIFIPNSFNNLKLELLTVAKELSRI